MNEIVHTERLLLSSILYDPDSFFKLKLKPDDFIGMNAVIFEAMSRILGRGGKLTPTLLIVELGAMGQSVKPEEIADLAALSLSSDGIEDMEVAIKNAAMARRVIAKFDAIKKSLSSGAIAVSDAIGAALTALVETDDDGVLVSLGDAVSERIDEIEAISRGDFKPLTTGIEVIDNELGGGLFPGRVYLLLGRPGHGKSLFSVMTALASAEQSDGTVIIFSREATAPQVSVDFISAVEKDINRRRLKSGMLHDEDWEALMRAGTKLMNYPIFIDSKSATIEAMRLQVAKVAAMLKARSEGKYAPLLVAIDYLQLVDSTVKFKTTREKMEYISREIKRMALEFDVPIILVSSVTRETARRASGRPQLEDARESGQIEHDADVVLGFFREELVNPGTDTYGVGSNKGMIEVGWLKDRITGGAKRTVVIFMNPKTGRFAALNTEWQP